jgi:4,5-DOPA dioxygenase extradiol
MNRRQALAAIATAPLACRSRKEAMTSRMPVIFAAHGAPILLDDPAWMAELAAWAQKLPKPKSVLMVSAHWDSQPAALGATRTVPLVYDFYGFPQRYYQTKYPAPGAPDLATRVRGLFAEKSIPLTHHPERGLDHGAYIPMVAMYPEANVPILQLSLPSMDPGEIFRMGQALAPLRDEGVLIFGSGFLTHNMRYAFRTGTPDWAREFDHWVDESLTRYDPDALIDFMNRAPAAKTALPTTEHYVPLLVAAGAAGSSPKASFPITGWWMDGAFTKRSVELS